MSVKTKWLALGFSALTSTLGVAMAGEAKAQSVCETRPQIRVQVFFSGRIDTVCRDDRALVVRDPDELTIVADPNRTLVGGIDARAQGDLQISIPTNSPVVAAGAGILATSMTGSVNVLAGPITTTAQWGSGIYAEAAQGVTLTSRGAVLTSGEEVRAVAARGQGAVNVAVLAPITTTGRFSYAVHVGSNTSTNVAITAPIRVEANDSIGVNVFSYVTGCTPASNRLSGPCGPYLFAPATVSFTTIDVLGGNSSAISAFTDGGLQISGDAIRATGIGAGGVGGASLGPINVSLGSVEAQAGGVRLSSGFSTGNISDGFNMRDGSRISVAVGTGSGGGVQSGGTAVSLNSRNNEVELLVRPGAVVNSGTAAAVDLTGNLATVRNQGTISSAWGVAITGLSQQVRIVNEGVIRGRLMLGAETLGPNVLDLQNTGRLEFSGVSQLNASSTIRNMASGLTSFTGATSLAGLGRFENAGTVSGVNGQVGDVLSMPGVFVAQAGGRLAVDVSTTGADRLEVGSVQGTLAIQLNLLDEAGVIAPTPIVVAQSGTVAASLLGAPGGGLVQYSLRTNGGRLELVGAPNQGAFETSVLGAVSSNFWHKTASAWRGRAGSGVWIAGLNSEDLQYDTGAAFGVFGALVTPDLSYAQDHAGLAFGADKAFEVGGGRMAVGVMAGRQISNVRFDVSGDAARIKGAQVGAYASGEFGKVTGQVLAMRSTYDSDAQMRGRSHGVMAEVGYRLDLTPALSVRPLAGLALVDTKLKSYAVGGTTVTFDDLTSLRASVGAEAAWTSGLFTPYLRAKGVQELARTHDVTMSSANGVAVLRYKPEQLSGEVEAGIRMQAGKFAGGVGVQQQFGDVEGLTVIAAAALQF